VLVVLSVGVQCALSTAFLGPNNEAYQSPVNGFNPNPNLDPASTGPKNIGEEYRRNTPVIYYSFDQQFIDFFGTSGMAAIDRAFEVYNGLTNVSAYSASMSELPLEAQRINYRAQALFLLDVKSSTMALIAEQLGLAEPERYVWALHSRWHVGTVPCPVGQNYTVIQRNFDPVISSPDQLQPSSYVNGTLYSYTIIEFCNPPPATIAPLEADAAEFSVDPLASTFTSIASGFGEAPFLLGGTAWTVLGGLLEGGYYTGLTRDDVGGLRYLLRTNNMNFEAAGSDTVTFITNTVPQLLYTSNLNLFATQALTNAPGALVALYPDLQIASSTAIFTNVVTTNVIYYFTNFPLDPVGTPAALVGVPIVSTNVATYWNHQFLNAFITPEYQLVSNTQIPVVPGHSFTNGIVTLLVSNVTASACPPFTPYGSICTNVSAPAVIENGNFGDYYILPTNLCAISIISTQLITVVYSTNGTLIATNAPTTTNTANEFFSVTPIYTFKQYIYVVRPVVCPSNSVALRQGIERIRFERRDYDSLIGQFFYPVTNDYVLNSITNSTLRPQVVRRTVLVPDILITAQDLAGGPGDATFAAIARSLQFDTNSALPGLAGPGTLTSPTAFTYNKVGPLYVNGYPLLSEADGLPLLIWGSFDGSTNPPVVYPNGTSIVNMENQVLIQVSPVGPALPDGKVGVNYTNMFSGFTVNGGLPPYSWALSGTAGLPPGLSLNSTTGAISGVPTAPGVYDFTLRMSDSGTRFVELSYSIAVNL